MERDVAEVSAFEAKTRLSELLREAEHGRSFVICRRGRAVARLGPVPKDDEVVDLAGIVKAFRELRQRATGPVRVRALVEEGRRH